MADILLALDCGDIAFLTLLYLSAAFDTVDHATLLKRMEISYGLNGPFMHGGTFCPAGRMSADISTSKRWKKLRFYDFALISIVYKMA